MRNNEKAVELLEQARFEVLPTGRAVEDVVTHLPAGRTVTVTASPARGLDATLDTALALAAQGYPAVPHVAARMVVDRSHLLDIVARLHGGGVDQVFVPGGDGAPAGSFADALGLVTDLTRLGSPFRTVGVTAYPESHPTIPDDMTIQAMWDKRQHATEMVSNLTFDPEVVATWLARIRRRGVTLPVWLGVPGPADSRKLLEVASRIGVGDSTRFLLRNRRTVARLMRPGGFRAEDFLRALAPTLARPESLVVGLHVFTFNQVADSEAWRVRLLDQLRTGTERQRRVRRGARPQARSL